MLKQNRPPPSAPADSEDTVVTCSLCGESIANANAARKHHCETLRDADAGAAAEIGKDANDSDDSDDSSDGADSAELSQAQLFLLAYLTLCREHYGVKDACMDDFKRAVTQFAHSRDRIALKKLSRRFGVPQEEIQVLAGLLVSPFKGMENKNQEYKAADAAFDPVYNCAPRILGHDEKGRPQVVVDFPFPAQLRDLLSDGDLYADAHREIIDDGDWTSDVQHGGLWKAHPMVRAGVSPYLVSLWMDGGEITGFMGPRRGKWKFVFAAWKLLNSSAEHQTKQSNMRLAFLCHEKTFRDYGAGAVISGARDADGEYQADTSWGSWMRLGFEGALIYPSLLVRSYPSLQVLTSQKYQRTISLSIMPNCARRAMLSSNPKMRAPSNL